MDTSTKELLDSILPHQSTLMDIYKKSMAYELETVTVNDDGTTTHLHSDAFLDQHPERRDSPEYTEAEEIEQIEFLAKIAKVI